MISPRYDVILNSDFALSKTMLPHTRHAGVLALTAMHDGDIIDAEFQESKKLLMLNFGGDGYGDFLIYIDGELISIEKNSYFVQSKTLFFANEIYAKRVKVRVKNTSWQMQTNNYYAILLVR